MPPSRRSIIGIIVGVLVLGGALAWFLTHRANSASLAVAPEALSRWTLIASDGTDPWVVGVTPPASLTAALFQEVVSRYGKGLIAPAHPALPLVLRTEFDEGLQGVYGIDAVLRIARDAGIETARYQPVCLAHRTSDGASGRAELYFVPFESAAFNQMRLDLTPNEPEHAGIGVYEPSTLIPILMVAATDGAFERWWPLAFDRATDCEADLGVASAQN